MHYFEVSPTVVKTKLTSFPALPLNVMHESFQPKQVEMSDQSLSCLKWQIFHLIFAALLINFT